MAQLWGGRFTKETDMQVYNFNASIRFDKRLLEYDIEGSVAHATMLGKQGIITDQEMDIIVSNLNSILEDVEAGHLVVSENYEDVHSFVEANLIKRTGDVGKKLHTGRSRNDQVALDMRLFVRNSLVMTDKALYHLLESIFKIIEDNVETYMPGFTHLQKAQPLSLIHI